MDRPSTFGTHRVADSFTTDSRHVPCQPTEAGFGSHRFSIRQTIV